MNKTSRTDYFLRKSPLVRTLLWCGVAVLFFGVSFIIALNMRKKPKIYSLDPPVGTEGDLVVINGKDFGKTRDSNYVEFCGSRLTAASYVSWNDNEIKVVLPHDIQDGLVYVARKNIRSKPAFFANSMTIPVEVPEEVIIQGEEPQIIRFLPEKVEVGTLVTILGRNFGNNKNDAKVYFSAIREENANDENSGDEVQFVSAKDGDFDYFSWSDSEIKVYVPDGAVSGEFFVETAKGQSETKDIKIEHKSGTKSFISPKNYVLQVACNIENNSTDKDASIILRVPCPLETASQILVKLVESNVEPIILDDKKTLLHQVGLGKSAITHNWTVTAYDERNQITASALKAQDAMNKTLYEELTKADDVILCNDEKVKTLLASIIQKEKNPYNIAALVYNYMVQNFKVLREVRRGKVSPLDMIKTKKGDAYDFATLFVALMRAAKIPCVLDSGILIESNLQTKNHWWAEIYFSGFGYFPVDVALGAGLEYQSWHKDVDAASFYFGNLDAQHILWTRGMTETKMTSQNSKTVQLQKMFALQNIWEEATNENVKYTSFWQTPIVVGVY